MIQTGITPAYAGKSLSGSKPCFRIQDHPRVCGEKIPWYQRTPRTWGSPPRMRGKEYLACRRI